MSIPVITFFNNKGGVGKTTLIYHLAWMFAELGLKTLSADLDPQANLTAAFLKEEELELIWPEGPHFDTIAGSLDPLRRGIGDIATPTIQVITPRLFLLAGDLQLSNFEDELSVVSDVLEHGASYERQRAVYARTGDLISVVDALVTEFAEDRFCTHGDGGHGRK